MGTRSVKDYQIRVLSLGAPSKAGCQITIGASPVQTPSGIEDTTIDAPNSRLP